MGGLCICYPGFHGSSCDEYSPSSPCYGNPCQNSGTCFPTNGGKSILCYCVNGFTGARCESAVAIVVNISKLTGGSDATPSPAMNSTTEGTSQLNHTNSVNFIHSNDTAHFTNETEIFMNGTGTFDNSTQDSNETNWYDNQLNNTSTFQNRTANNDTDYGFNNNSMQCNITTCRAGQCVNMNNNTSVCVCFEGWGGVALLVKKLQFDNLTLNYPHADPCESYPCLNNGSCLSNGTDYICNCLVRYEGRDCEIKIPKPCDPSPCANGICTEISNGTSYTCECYEGYEGQNCDWISGIRVCEEKPCQNGGSCQRFGPTSYKCSCAWGYAGRNCDIYEGTACDRNPCNYGSCTATGRGKDSYICNCKLGYLGRNCDRADVGTACDSQPCRNGTCSLNTNTDYTCACFPGYTGRYCQHRLTACYKMPCSNGYCTDVDGGRDYRCTCYGGFGGRNCDRYIGLPCHNNECYNGGLCQNVNNYRDFQCTCQPGFYGRQCQDSISQTTVPPTTEATTQKPTESSIGRCGGNFTGSRGILTSPRFPQSYPPRARCIYEIHLPKHQRIDIRFDTFDLEAGIFGCYDILRIYDGGHYRHDLAAAACGKRRYLRYESKTNLIYIVFMSDKNIERKGFYATYSAVEDKSPCKPDTCKNNGKCIAISSEKYKCRCERGYIGERCESKLITKTFKTRSGLVASPNYFGEYAKSVRCIFTITAPTYRHVLLTFERFHLSNPDTNGKCSEFMKIIDGSTRSRRILFNGCGIRSPGTLMSSYNRMTIIYVTNNARTGYGFKATYRTRYCEYLSN
ncbi:uncharacterized protein TRIADDRAFT_57600 [Trichoplax adhaerens]|uniref:Cubilin n=1 Tax=Trichoplax adhaerens TaxID=10228 RepID=B3RZW6_TRIAD|nr:hypothetical protein TRIADDRAFT_57600 [Trichoplax adhaerens]EDV24282.1 hypothetical protein TRIADDRAFT_57600 [Trichoplax adhaerens]|eukprot:XP_002113808.1 hypothetical protein TRIADDRAFT_57600 [Trichoplax adhaerens]